MFFVIFLNCFIIFIEVCWYFVMVFFVNEGVFNSRGVEFLWNDELEIIDIDVSDYEDWMRSFVKVGLFMV